MPDTNEQPTPKARDFRQEVTDNIVALLEKGVAPWQKPWDPQSHPTMPVNPTTDRSYRGGNAVHLLAVGMQRSYEDPRWMTYKQAAEQGWQVRRGERGTQIDGIPALTPKESKPFEVVEAGERILANSGAKIAHDQADRAFYDRHKDEIHLPPQQSFKNAAGYYGTALHELGHWTGHPSRLDRWTLTENYKFGDTKYAKEELRAELASVFLAAEKGIPHDPQNHPAYVGSWIQSLKQDKNEIFRAAHDASKAADLLLSLDRDISIADQSLEKQETEPATTISETSQLQHDREVIQEQSAEQPSAESGEKVSSTGPFKPGDKVMAYEPYFYGGKPKPNPWTPAIVASLYANEQYISYVRPQNENGNKAVEYASKGEMHHASPQELKQHETEFAILEQRLPHSLREQMEAEKNPEGVTTRESTQVVARHDPENGAVSVSDKQSGAERRTPVAKPELKNGSDTPLQNRASTVAGHLEDASSLTTQLLGENAKTRPATLIVGNYRGQIVAETPDILLQRLSPKSIVVHEKDLFNEVPKVGANVAINYINGNPSVRAIKERGRALEMSR